MLSLTVRYRQKTLRLDVPFGESSLGSAPENGIVVPLPGISRVHARVVGDVASITIHDAGSKNGLALDGKPVASVELAPGVTAQAGSVSLSVEDAETSEIEMALVIGASNEAREESRDTRSHESSSSGESSATRALAFVRALERRGGFVKRAQRDAFLGEVRALLGADALVLVHSEPGVDPSVASLAGSLPNGLASLLRDLPAKLTGPIARSVPDGSRFLVAPAGGPLLAAAFTNPSEAPARWKLDFLDYAAEKLRHERSSARDDAQGAAWPAAAGELALPPGMIAGRSPALRDLLEQIRSTLRSRMDVLLMGDTGTGKELFARMIHASGPSPAGPFVAINCAAIPSELLESELFGVQARVATGVDPRVGLFVQAHQGTIFLDEIGELAQPLQAKLLRVLQEREVLPVGGSVPRKIDLRVVSASNRNLESEVHAGRFRADLFYRLRGLRFHIPPLRDRREDIPELVVAFAQRASREYGKRIRGVSRKALALLMAHDWPGNVRELESEVKRAVLTCHAGGVVDSSHFGTVRWAVEKASNETVPVSAAAPVVRSAASLPRTPEDTLRPLQEQLDEVEQAAIEAALQAASGNKSLAARILGITRNGLASKLLRLHKPT